MHVCFSTSGESILNAADYEAMEIYMHVGVKRKPCTFTIPAILEMKIWDCCHANNTTQLKHAATAMHATNLQLLLWTQ